MRLESLYENAPSISLSAKDKWVVFSDLHMGDGGAGDDFRINADLFSHTLEKHYGPENFGLILNGDVEELLRYRRQAIAHSWKRIYRLLDAFRQQKRLIKIFGNHDYELNLPNRRPRRIPVQETVKFDFHGQTLFVLHGHQASWFLELFRFLVAMSLRFLARPLRIRNYSVARSSRKKFAVERRVYEFARTRRLIALIGHTHRPLFESLSKKENLKFQIEQLCRQYVQAAAKEKGEIENRIRQTREELRDLLNRRKSDPGNGMHYGAEPLVPCLFNSGCAIGKKGITAIEIEEGRIRLVYWFDRNRDERPFGGAGASRKIANATPFSRLVLQEESLDYIFTRIRLLA